MLTKIETKERLNFCLKCLILPKQSHFNWLYGRKGKNCWPKLKFKWDWILVQNVLNNPKCHFKWFYRRNDPKYWLKLKFKYDWTLVQNVSNNSKKPFQVIIQPNWPKILTKIEIQVGLNFDPKCLKQPSKAISSYILDDMTQNVDQNWNSNGIELWSKMPQTTPKSHFKLYFGWHDPKCWPKLKFKWD